MNTTLDNAAVILVIITFCRVELHTELSIPYTSFYFKLEDPVCLAILSMANGWGLRLNGALHTQMHYS